ncbi:hypothetical protein [Streptomyces sp. JB150]|uniref:hypothetical protein n=1 Tax=Streptomyces sp. JB150 TaxID=2714844 RepID=UPI00140A1F02|nr:hypothetical protein [Streptomyces sp. JB150]QIJ65221.1 hypothetical protein G7Z13_26705 [Streptomyces sp. JB150]
MPTPKIHEATAARNALAAALTSAGIQLPAMDVRTHAAAGYALIHLGVCSAPVARALADVIAKGAAR